MPATAAISANPLKLDLRSHLKCVFICFIATLSTFQYGLDYAVIGGFLSMQGFLQVFGYKVPPKSPSAKPSWNIDPTVQQLISSLMVIGTFVSSLAVGPFSQKYGRKKGLWAATLVNFVATGIMIGTRSVGVLYFSRFLLGKYIYLHQLDELLDMADFLIGISVGWFLTFSQVYVHEVAPVSHPLLGSISFTLSLLRRRIFEASHSQCTRPSCL